MANEETIQQSIAELCPVHNAGKGVTKVGNREIHWELGPSGQDRPTFSGEMMGGMVSWQDMTDFERISTLSAINSSIALVQQFGDNSSKLDIERNVSERKIPPQIAAIITTRLNTGNSNDWDVLCNYIYERETQNHRISRYIIIE